MRPWVVIAAVMGATGVAAGAFGAHALAPRLSAQALAVFETGAHYHLVHAVALMAAALAGYHLGRRWCQAAAVLFTAGIVLFSGSLYVLAVTGVGAFGVITPFGGLAFLLGWGALALAAGRGPR